MKQTIVNLWKEIRLPLIISSCIFIGYILVSLWSSAYITPGGGVPGMWRENRIMDLKSALYNLGKTWDSKHYAEISRSGYNTKADSNFAFFPLLPMEIRVVSTLTRTSAETAAVLTGGINFVIFSTILFLFLKRFCQEHGYKVDLLSTFYTCLLLPYSFFYVTAYTESLFLALTLGIFYLVFFEIDNPKVIWLLPILTALLSITRSVGIIMGPVLVLYAIYKFDLWKVRSNLIQKLQANWKSLSILALSCLSLVAGISAFFYHNYLISGDFFKSREVQRYWGRGNTWNILEPVAGNVYRFIDLERLKKVCGPYIDCYYGDSYPLVATFLFIISLIAFWYWAKPKWEVQHVTLMAFSILAFVMPLTSDSMTSLNRYLLAAPSYAILLPIWLHQKLPQTWIQPLQLVLTIIQTIYLVLYIGHFWIG